RLPQPLETQNKSSNLLFFAFFISLFFKKTVKGQILKRLAPPTKIDYLNITKGLNPQRLETHTQSK
ncbi:hypothetical protein PQ628_15260, partial [Bacteroides ovatus]